MRLGFWLALVLSLVISCIDEKDYDLNSAEVSPSMAIPLAHGEMAIQDILKGNDSVNIKVDANDLVYLEYARTLISQDIRDLFSIPDKGINQSFALHPGTLAAHSKDIRSDSLVEVFDFGLGPEQLSMIDFQSGNINYSATLLPGNSNLQYEVLLTSSDFTSKTDGHHLSLVANGSGSVPLSDYKVTLNKNKFNLKMVLVLKKTSLSRTIGPNTSVAVNFSMAGMNFNVILGFFGDQTANPPADLLSIGAFGTSLGSAQVSFAQPSVALEVVNDYGVPCRVNFSKIEARKPGAVLSLQLNPANPVPIAFPGVLGNSASTLVAVTNSKQVLDFGPTEFFYQLSARINQGLTSGSNFLADTSKLRVKLKVNVPIYGHASGIILRDTVSLDLNKVDQSNVKKASLKVYAVNELPLDARIQLFLIDDHDAVMDSLIAEEDTGLIKGSTVTGTGDLETAGVIDKMLVLDESKLNKIFEAKRMIVVAVLNTSKDATGNSIDVKFKSKYIIKVNVGLLADLNFNIKF